MKVSWLQHGADPTPGHEMGRWVSTYYLSFNMLATHLLGKAKTARTPVWRASRVALSPIGGDSPDVGVSLDFGADSFFCVVSPYHGLINALCIWGSYAGKLKAD